MTNNVTKNSRRKSKKAYFFRRYFHVIILSVLILCAFIFYITNQPFAKVKDGQIVRNLDISYLFFQNDPEEREYAWDSELPKLIQKDLAYADKHNLGVTYIFKKTKVEISKDEYDNDWGLVFYSPYVYFYDSSFGYNGISFKNFSFYKSDKNLVIYGYANDLNWFRKAVISEGKFDSNTLGIDCNLPFALDTYDIPSCEIGEYSMVLLNGNEFNFYKKGKWICSQTFSNGTLKNQIYGRYVVTENNELYMMCIENKEDKPYLKFIYIDVIDCIPEYNSILSTNDDTDETSRFLSARIFIKDEQEYVLVPNDWHLYKLSNIYNYDPNIVISNPDYSAKLVPLKDCMTSIKFIYENECWSYTITYDLNGIEFERNKFVSGYDPDTTLPEEVAKKYIKTVTSWKEFWENVEQIRIAYFDYYEHGED